MFCSYKNESENTKQQTELHERTSSTFHTNEILKQLKIAVNGWLPNYFKIRMCGCKGPCDKIGMYTAIFGPKKGQTRDFSDSCLSW